jgi:hypothetical protein
MAGSWLGSRLKSPDSKRRSGVAATPMRAYSAAWRWAMASSLWMKWALHEPTGSPPAVPLAQTMARHSVEGLVQSRPGLLSVQPPLVEIGNRTITALPKLLLVPGQLGTLARATTKAPLPVPVAARISWYCEKQTSLREIDRAASALDTKAATATALVGWGAAQAAPQMLYCCATPATSAWARCSVGGTAGAAGPASDATGEAEVTATTASARAASTVELRLRSERIIGPPGPGMAANGGSGRRWWWRSRASRAR